MKNLRYTHKHTYRHPVVFIFTVIFCKVSYWHNLCGLTYILDLIDFITEITMSQNWTKKIAAIVSSLAYFGLLESLVIYNHIKQYSSSLCNLIIFSLKVLKFLDHWMRERVYQTFCTSITISHTDNQTFYCKTFAKMF